MRRLPGVSPWPRTLFQSTHPVWDATAVGVHEGAHTVISIHASRMGCDTVSRFRFLFSGYFNPRIPYGMRRGKICGTVVSVISIHASRMGCDANVSSITYKDFIFQSTHPVWDATCTHRLLCFPDEISIHASRMGCDMFAAAGTSMLVLFQSTHPVWDATARMDIAFHNMEIFARSSS